VNVLVGVEFIQHSLLKVRSCGSVFQLLAQSGKSHRPRPLISGIIDELDESKPRPSAFVPTMTQEASIHFVAWMMLFCS
jgi:hypothetical protein